MNYMDTKKSIEAAMHQVREFGRQEGFDPYDSLHLLAQAGQKLDEALITNMKTLMAEADLEQESEEEENVCEWCGKDLEDEPVVLRSDEGEKSCQRCNFAIDKPIYSQPVDAYIEAKAHDL